MVTGTRADFSLLYHTMQAINNDPSLELLQIVTGTHLSPEFGSTCEEITDTGLPVHKRIEILLSSDTSVGASKAMGLGMISFSEAFAELKPDIVLLLGDRFEALAAAASAAVGMIPIAHVHGGELTAGALDDSLRHAITKLSHLHFTSAEPYRQRVIQLGEAPERVFNVGAPGLENIRKLELLNRSQLEESLGLELPSKTLMVTFHPETLEPGKNSEYLRQLLSALEAIDDTFFLFTMPNADVEGRALRFAIETWCKERPVRSAVFESLGFVRYLSTLRHVSAVVGNSSSGILEAPSLGTPTVNIGRRQDGRIRSASILDCDPTSTEIVSTIRRALTEEFKAQAQSAVSPYGDGNVSNKIKQVLLSFDPRTLLRKSFYDLPPLDVSV